MAMYIMSGKQVAGFTTAVAIFIAGVVVVTKLSLDILDLPEVYVDGENKCVKVVNYKNGDGYACQDKDVTLRKYNVVHVK